MAGPWQFLKDIRDILRDSDVDVGNFPDIQTVNLPSLSASAYESITVSDAVVELTAATYGDAVMAFITVEDESMRARWDGTDPTAAEGHLAGDGDTIPLMSAADIANFRAIRADADDATIRVTYSE